MKCLFTRFWNEEDGVLAFEWVLLNSVVVLGAVAGLAAVRNAINDEMADLTEAITSLDQSYVIQAPLAIGVHNVNGYGGGGVPINSQINDGAGYNSKAWQEFLNNHPGYNTPQRGTTIQGVQGRMQNISGSAGSAYIDYRPAIDRNIDTGMAPPLQDQSGMIDNAQ